ncbi:Acyl-CoA ligase sidI [Fulvia fulva]|nr:Acyl-CoA ligase sidI [Fulvia fulva]WPV21308.1 Acyl-CoA ligase sidI [Fulvia fulva]
MSPHSTLAEGRGGELDLPIVTLQELFTGLAEDFPDKTALICRHQSADFLHQTSESSNVPSPCLRWTHSQLYDAGHLLATRLHALGLRNGMRIAAFLRNGAQFAVGLYAAALLGAVFVPINPAMAGKPEEVDHMLHTADASALLAWDVDMAKALDRALSEGHAAKLMVKAICNTADTCPDGWHKLEALLDPNSGYDQLPLEDANKAHLDDLAVIIFTSGTTSRPKGVKQLHRTLVAAVRSSTQNHALDSSRSFCDNLPSFHIFGITYMLNWWSAGGSVCFPSELFDPEATLQAINDEKLTNIAGVPTMYQAMIRAKASMNVSMESVLAAQISGTALSPEILKQISQGLGVQKVATSFGMSEATPLCAVPYRDLPYDFSKSELVCLGKPGPGARIRICKPNSREVVERGESGELHAGGLMVTNGYLGGVKGEFYEDDGTSWLVSGDQAVMEPSGEIFVMGRYKDLIIRGGENISPASIEAVVDTLPGITSQVIGVPDEIAGEVPLAIIKPTTGDAIDKDGVREVVAKRMGELYIPAETISIQDLGIEDFPKTDSGKVQKAELRGVVANFLSNRDEQENATNRSSSNQDTLHQVWSDLLGMSKAKLDVSTSILDLADSITIMRASSKIKRKMGHVLTTGEVVEYPTIEQQAELLDSRDGTMCKSPNTPPVAIRQGPPGVSDMAHALGNPRSVEHARMAFESVASELGLSWEQDVEDVVPIWDFGQVLLRRLRAQSWNHRHAWVATKASAKQLRSALETALTHQPMLRTMAAQPEGSPPLHYIVRPSETWFNAVITEVDAVENAEDLRTLCLNDPKLDFAASPGPLFQAIIVPIKGTGTAGLVYQAQHSCFDGLSIPNLREDLKTILSEGQNASIAPRTPYKVFADALLLHRSSAQANADVEYHVRRLRGLGKMEQSFWPIQRAPEWFKGNFADAADDLIKKRPLIDGDKSIGVDGVTKRTKLPHLQKLIKEHGFSAPAILKTALALLNSHYTNTNIAIFTNYDAGRNWPFLSPWIAEHLPNAMDINGPTFEAVLNNITIDPNESVLTMISSINNEQTLLTKHAHAPLFEIQKQLGNDVPAGTDLTDIMRRQIFNWLPGLKEAMSESDDSPLKRTQVQSRSDVGILWNCGMLDQEMFQMNASYDDAQLRKAEVEEAVERLFGIARWITEPGNWEKGVGECSKEKS